MKNAARLVALLPVLALALGGCIASSSEIDMDDVRQAGGALALSSADAARVLDLVNYPGTDAALLDGAVGLDSRAAAGILAHRNGADGLANTIDDNLFDDIAELDAIPYVADSAFSKLVAYAAAHPAPAAESVEGVSFKGWEAEAVIWGVNHATVAELDGAVGLDARAAGGLVAKAPFATVTSMGPVAYVGTSALQKLKAHAGAWRSAMVNVKICAPDLQTQLAPVIDGLTYMSESDRPFTPFLRASTNAGAITASELGLSGATETWTIDTFFAPEWMDDPYYGTKYTQLEQILRSDLTDLTVIRTGHIEITVYIVGRTSCGEIAGLTTVAIET